MSATCRSCQAPIVWAEIGGKRIPLDAQPVDGGNLAVRREAGGRLVARPITADHPPLPDEHAGITHFATCPNADRHRKASR